MRAAGFPGATDVFPKPGGFRRAKLPAAWVLRPVRRDADEEDYERYEPGLILTVEGRFHVLESEVRGWGQRDFPRFVDAPAREPVEMPLDERLIGELDAVLREHGVVTR
jgi:hypothetical protein